MTEAAGSRLFATSARGLELLLAAELAPLGATAIEAGRGGVAFSGGLDVAYRACLWSRVASRLLLELASFVAPEATALYEGVAAIAWEEHIPPAATIAVDATILSSPLPPAGSADRAPALSHSHYVALKTKDAIVDRLRARRGSRPSVDTQNPTVRLRGHFDGERATVSLDLAGESLHRRGYRLEAGPAPLKENLAAALLLLAGWPALAAEGAPFLDPMCGSGTLAIEAALIAAQVAPGLRRARFGFEGWARHDSRLFATLREEALARQDLAVANPAPIVGRDADPAQLRLAATASRRAGIERRVRFEPGPFEEALPPAARPGLLVTNPPYGERIGSEEDLGSLYETLGDVLRRHFPGWRAGILTGSPPLAKRLGLRPSRRHVVWNGAIECRFLELAIAATPPTSAEGPVWRRPRPASPAAAMLVNRLQKNLRRLGSWAAREGITCYRVYDADLPEYAVAIDLYEGAAHVQEYEAPATVEPERAAERLADVLTVLPGALGLAASEVHLKVRRRQGRRHGQYERQAERGVFRTVHEGDLRFLVNLTDYLDTGLFLDQRRLRQLVRELAEGRRVLNLFAYTATASVHAAAGGAVATTSVDLSATYLDWAKRNFALNQLSPQRHELVRADCLEWLPRQRRRFGLALVAPPTFSHSKGMDSPFDVQDEHPALLQAVARLMEPGGVVLFVAHRRGFKLAAEALPGWRADDVSAETLPVDFARRKAMHHVVRFSR